MKSHFEAELTFRATGAGGRRQPCFLSSYRPDARFPHSNEVVYGVHFYKCGSPLRDPQTVAPGETVTVEVIARAWEGLVNHVRVGTTFKVCEGPHDVADGVVTRIISTDTQLGPWERIP